MNDTTNKTDANTAKRAEFLYDVKTGNWTGYVQRHDGTVANRFRAAIGEAPVYDLCDTSKGNAFYWDRYTKEGFQVSVRNMTAYDEDHAGLGGGPIARQGLEEINFELGDDGLWTGRLVNKKGAIFYDMRAAFKQNAKLAALWVRKEYRSLANFGSLLNTCAVVAPSPPTDLVGFYTEDRYSIEHAPSEQAVRRTTPVQPLPMEERDDIADKIFRMAKHPRDLTYSVIITNRGSITGQVFRDGVDVSDQFKDTDRTPDAFFARVSELGGDTVAWAYRTPEEKKNFVTKIADEPESMLPGSTGTGPDPVLDEAEADGDVEWVSKQAAVHDVNGVDPNRSASATEVFAKAAEAFQAKLEGEPKAEEKGSLTPSDNNIHDPAALGVMPEHMLETAKTAPAASEPPGDWRAEIREGEELEQELRNASAEVMRADEAQQAAQRAVSAAKKKVEDLSRRVEQFQARRRRSKVVAPTQDTAVHNLEVVYDIGPDASRAYVRVTHAATMHANLDLSGFEGLKGPELSNRVVEVLLAQFKDAPLAWIKKMTPLDERVHSVDAFTGLKMAADNIPTIRLKNK